MTNKIHASGISEWKKCRLAHHYKYVMDLYPLNKPMALEFGTAAHAMMEAYYDPEKWERGAFENYTRALKAGLNVNHTQLSEALNVHATPINVANIEDDYSNRAQLLESMIDRWHTKDRFDFEQDYLRPIAVEQRFEVEHLGYSLGGTIDMVMQDERTGKVWLVDWKHVSSYKEAINERLELDEQVNFYFFVANTFLYPNNVAGFMYVERTKAYVTAPKELARRWGGKLFSTAKDQMITLDDFVTYVKEYDSEAFINGAYNDYIEWLAVNEPQTTRITKLRKNADGYKNYQQELDVVLKEMKKPVVFGANSFVCQWCTFKQVCNERLRGGDWEEMLNVVAEEKVPYYERVE